MAAQLQYLPIFNFKDKENLPEPRNQVCCLFLAKFNKHFIVEKKTEGQIKLKELLL